jgi:hypothetical protein
MLIILWLQQLLLAGNSFKMGKKRDTTFYIVVSVLLFIVSIVSLTS